jgi:hypothetical protein
MTRRARPRRRCSRSVKHVDHPGPPRHGVGGMRVVLERDQAPAGHDLPGARLHEPSPVGPVLQPSSQERRRRGCHGVERGGITLAHLLEHAPAVAAHGLEIARGRGADPVAAQCAIGPGPGSASRSARAAWARCPGRWSSSSGRRARPSPTLRRTAFRPRAPAEGAQRWTSTTKVARVRSAASV